MRSALVAAQDSVIGIEFGSGHDFLKRVADDMLARLDLPTGTRDISASAIADLPMADLRCLWEGIYRDSGAEEDVVASQSIAAAERSQLVRAFTCVNTTLAWIEAKVMEIITDLPKKADDIRVGRNKGDVLDPYILVATQYMLCGGDQGRAMDATVAHKALMILEGMLGHLHEETIGQMRGNVRVPEPRGDFAGVLNLEENPFPGADVVQPPLALGEAVSFHQVKSKTGSMNSSAGEQLAYQMKKLAATYEGAILYSHSLVGNTLTGHRTMGGMHRVEDSIVCTVGDFAFRTLTHSENGAELLLRVYQTAFRMGAKKTAYDILTAASIINEQFEAEAAAAGDGFLESLLHKAVQGEEVNQDSKLYIARREAARNARSKRL